MAPLVGDEAIGRTLRTQEISQTELMDIFAPLEGARKQEAKRSIVGRHVMP
jgi:hypothetical protein